MSRQPDRRSRHSVVAACVLLLVPVVCCVLPLVVVSGTLAGVGAWLHSDWLVGTAIVLLAVAAVIAWRTRR